jgi:hypothetical protein
MIGVLAARARRVTVSNPFPGAVAGHGGTQVEMPVLWTEEGRYLADGEQIKSFDWLFVFNDALFNGK